MIPQPNPLIIIACITQNFFRHSRTGPCSVSPRKFQSHPVSPTVFNFDHKSSDHSILAPDLVPGALRQPQHHPGAIATKHYEAELSSLLSTSLGLVVVHDCEGRLRRVGCKDECQPSGAAASPKAGGRRLTGWTIKTAHLRHKLLT